MGFIRTIKRKILNLLRIAYRCINLIYLKLLQNMPEKINPKNKSSSQLAYYPEFALKASLNPKIYKTFRRHPDYTSILEHVPKNIAQEYLNIINQKYSINNSKLLDIIAPLQEIGMPKKCKLEGLNIRVSTTALRYLKVALEIKEKLIQKGPVDIVEIGCGYGGQAVILNQIIEIKSYTFIDLWQVNMLIKRFLNDVFFEPPFSILGLNDLDENPNYWDLLISNYSFSELPRHIQEIYYRKVINFAKHGYMIMNSGEEGKFGKIQNFTKKECLQKINNSYISNEIPLTAKNNYLIRW